MTTQTDLIKKYEAKLETVKAMHTGWKGKDYVAYAELELEAVKANGMEGLKEVWKMNA